MSTRQRQPAAFGATALPEKSPCGDCRGNPVPATSGCSVRQVENPIRTVCSGSGLAAERRPPPEPAVRCRPRRPVAVHPKPSHIAEGAERRTLGHIGCPASVSFHGHRATSPDPEPSIAPAGSTPEGGHREMKVVAAAIRAALETAPKKARSIGRAQRAPTPAVTLQRAEVSPSPAWHNLPTSATSHPAP